MRFQIGLDYHYDLSPRDVQQEVLKRQLKHAIALGKPITIHTREGEFSLSSMQTWTEERAHSRRRHLADIERECSERAEATHSLLHRHA